MKNKRKKLCMIMMTGVLCMTALSGCSSEKTPDTTQGSDRVEKISEESSQPQSLYEFPLMGMNVSLPESLLERDDVVMFMDQIGTEDGSALKYGFLKWDLPAAESQNIEDEADLPEAYDLESNSGCVGVLGVYQADMIDQLDELTGCDQHQELGESADSAYKYYMSINTKADQELTDRLSEIQVTITGMEPFEQYADAPAADFTETSLGKFTTQDINGQTYTQDMFQDYDLTMVNVFTTWCSPCVAEIPDLEKLRSNMADKGVNVVGIVMDILDENGEIDQESLEKAKLLAERTGASYPFLIPDATYMNGRLIGIEAVPETFFVDRNGNIVGETYSGSAGLEEWTSVVEKELSNLKEEM